MSEYTMTFDSEPTKTCHPNSSCLGTISDNSIRPDGGSPEFRPLLRHGSKLLDSGGRLDNEYNQKIIKLAVASTIEPRVRNLGRILHIHARRGIRLRYHDAGPAEETGLKDA